MLSMQRSMYLSASPLLNVRTVSDLLSFLCTRLDCESSVARWLLSHGDLMSFHGLEMQDAPWHRVPGMMLVSVPCFGILFEQGDVGIS